jgi:hypothetical protein
VSQFSELEMRMYILIKARITTKAELEEYYILDEALKLFALYRMDCDIEAFNANELKNKSRR